MQIQNSQKRIARLLVFCLFASLVFSAGAQAASVSDFSDISATAWYYDSVSYVVEKGLYNGVSAESFAPKDSMTRAMFITVLGRYAGVNPNNWCLGLVNASEVNFRSGAGTGYGSYGALSKGTNCVITGRSGDWYAVTIGSRSGYVYASYITPTYHRFSDVSYGKYYTGYAIWAYEKGYISGYGDAATFAPNVNITREQICKILNSYASVNGFSMPEKNAAASFADDGDIHSWARDAVYAMQKYGVVNGVVSGGGCRFEPQRSATRCEVAKLICGLIDASGVAPATSTEADVSTGGDSTGGGSSTGGGTGGGSTGGGDVPAGDFAAPIGESAISLAVRRVRAGLFVKTKYKDTAVSSVTLYNTSGGGFSYGSIDGSRSFVSEGTVDASTVVVTTDGSSFTVKDGNGGVLLTRSGAFALSPAGDRPLTAVNGGLRYYGDFEFLSAYNDSSRITLVNVVGMDDYVKGVLPYEYSSSWPAETLKAAAVAARSYTQYYAETSVYIANYGFDIIANDGTQTYKGRDVSKSESEFAGSDAAVEATSNMYLTYNGDFCNCTFFSSDGGATEDCAHIWGGQLAYLTGRTDPYEAAIASSVSSYTYSNTCSRTSLGSLASALGLSTIARDGIRVNTYSDTGNVESVTVTDVNGRSATIGQNSSVTRFDFLSYFGFTYFSYRYTVRYDSSSDCFTVQRFGWGHNVGMSQWGAYSMAKYYDMSYRDILGFYYSGTTIRYGA